jgi:Zn-finger nucleic acid-binding protein
MLCPNCQTPLREREKEDVIIEVCPSCRGVWLDAGELEHLSVSERRYYSSRGYDDDDDEDDNDSRQQRFDGMPDRSRGPDDRRQPQQRRGGFLSNLFESFGGDGSD